jgi:threonine synthase
VGRESTTSFLSRLECTRCGRNHDAAILQNLCSCGAPLFPVYDLEAIRDAVEPDSFRRRAPHLWRYCELLPLASREHVVTIGEGWTPLLKAERLSNELGVNVYIKDESQNPTGTFKARGLAVAVSKAKELGVREIAIPSAGNAAGALTVYGGKAGMQVHVFMPETTPLMIRVECLVGGAKVRLVDGSIADAGRALQRALARNRWFDVSTFKEPYRVEGKKTMGIEVVEQLDWTVPDAIVYPTGGGTGLIGMWKAFQELGAMGWIRDERPRMIAVQSAQCAPVVKAVQEDATECEAWPNPSTLATGLNVPKSLADFLILAAIRESRGTALAVSETQIVDAIRSFTRLEGVFACPEGAATLAGLRELVEQERIDRGETVVLFNTGSGLKYLEVGKRLAGM